MERYNKDNLHCDKKRSMSTEVAIENKEQIQLKEEKLHHNKKSDTMTQDQLKKED